MYMDTSHAYQAAEDPDLHPSVPAVVPGSQRVKKPNRWGFWFQKPYTWLEGIWKCYLKSYSKGTEIIISTGVPDPLELMVFGTRDPKKRVPGPLGTPSPSCLRRCERAIRRSTLRRFAAAGPPAASNSLCLPIHIRRVYTCKCVYR